MTYFHNPVITTVITCRYTVQTVVTYCKLRCRAYLDNDRNQILNGTHLHTHLQVGPSVQKYLPDDLNPKIKEQLDTEMGAGGTPGMGAPPPQAPPAAQAPSAKPKAAANGKKKSETDKSAAQPAQTAAVQRGAHEQQHAVVGELLHDVVDEL